MVQKVAIVIHDGVQALDIAGPVDAFMEANAFIAPGDGYEVVLVAADRRPLRASRGMRIAADVSFAEARDDFAILLVAGGPALPVAAPEPALPQWLHGAPDRSGTTGSELGRGAWGERLCRYV